jgi:DNA-binding Xre family transcriptional regulator
MNKKRIGSKFDDFLREEGIFDEVEAAAIKRVIAFQIEREMERRKLSKTEMAKRMKTSRAAFERLLDPKNTSVTLNTLGRAASALGKKLRVELA